MHQYIKLKNVYSAILNVGKKEEKKSNSNRTFRHVANFLVIDKNE